MPSSKLPPSENAVEKTQGQYRKYLRAVQKEIRFNSVINARTDREANQILDEGLARADTRLTAFYAAGVSPGLATGVLVRLSGRRRYEEDMPMWSVDRTHQHQSDEGSGCQWTLPLVLPEVRSVHEQFAALTGAQGVLNAEVTLKGGIRFTASPCFVRASEAAEARVYVGLHPDALEDKSDFPQL